MSSNNFLPFPEQENAHIQERFIQQRRPRQALGMPMTTTEYPFAYQNPYNSMLSVPPFYGSLSRNRVLGIRRSNPMIHKLHQVRARMCMARRFGIGTHRARASFLENRVLVITRQIPVINHQVVDAAFTSFQDKSTYNLLEGSDSTVEIHGHEYEKLQDIEEQQDGLDLKLKL
ncbi:hypothetical protein CRYUN_Cryun03dG0121700 [Craigia yunnanensis]